MLMGFGDLEGLDVSVVTRPGFIFGDLILTWQWD